MHLIVHYKGLWQHIAILVSHCLLYAAVVSAPDASSRLQGCCIPELVWGRERGQGKTGRAKQLNNWADTCCWSSGMDMLQCPLVQLIVQHDYALLSSAHSKPLDALQVYLASASPPVRYPNVYGVDMPTKKEFVATDLSEEEIRKVTPHVLSSAHYVAMLLLGCNIQGAWLCPWRYLWYKTGQRRFICLHTTDSHSSTFLL